MNNSFFFQVRGIKLILTFTFLVLINSCSSDEPYVYSCQDGINDFQEINTLRVFQNGSEKDTLLTLVIRNEDDYERYLKERTVNVDFSRQTLVGGRYYASATDHIDKQTLTSYCSINELHYDVKLARGAGQTFTFVPFFIVIPKIPDDKKILFNVHY